MIPVVSDIFQILLDAIGWTLARIYDFVPNYGVSIIILTLIIRFILFPLGVKQIKSMQHMQAIQPRIKELQRKYKTDKQKVQEETMKLYKEAGVNPLGGCLPVLAQFPILIAMYSVLRAPGLEPVREDNQITAYEVTNNHLPTDSELFADTISHEHTSLAIVNLQCSASQAGTQAPINDTEGNPVVGEKALEGAEGQELGFASRATLDCGNAAVDKAAYIVMLLVMVGTTFFQQRQMQRASPPNAASSQQQAIMKVMPLFFGFIGYTFPAGLVLYWTVSNFFQVGQQTLLLRAGHIGPDALDRRMEEQKARLANKSETPTKRGFFGAMLERAEQERNRRDTAGNGKPPAPRRSSGATGTSSKSQKGRRSGNAKGGGSAKGARGNTKGGGSTPRAPKGSTPASGTKGSGPRRPRKPGQGSGGSDGSAS